MRVPLIDLKLLDAAIKQEIYKEMNEVIISSRFIMGPEVEITKNPDKRMVGPIAVIKDMIHAIGNDCNPLITGEEGKKSLKIVLSIYKSINIKKGVL